MFLHCLPGGKSYIDDPPSISEGWGGRVTDYRISVSVLCPAVLRTNTLSHYSMSGDMKTSIHTMNILYSVNIKELFP